MPTPAATAGEFCRGLARSRLVAPRAAERAYRRFRAAGGRGRDVDAFCRYVVAHLGLTEYQAALIRRGRADGFQLGDYTVLDRLGAGTTGGVYKAAHSSGQVVAVKVLPASKAADRTARARFRREGRLLAGLDHPNVARGFEVGRAGRVLYIVLEHVDGESLGAVLARRGRLPAPEAVRLARQALAGLGHLHDRGLVHRDLKPGNLMVAPGRGPTTLHATLKLLDVGLGRELMAAPGLVAARLTLDGAVLGTPGYLPPEQARDPGAVGPAGDQYGLGCVLFHLLAGRPPFPDRGDLAQLLRHALDAPDRLPGLPPGLQAVLDRLTAKDPAARYPSAGAAAAALAPFEPADAARAAPSVVLPAFRDWLTADEPTPPIDPPEPHPSRPARDVALVGLGAVGVLLVGAVLRLTQE